MTPVAGTRRVLANDVQSFRLARNGNQITMTATVLTADRQGRAGTRNFTTNVVSTTLLRNAVS
jgi:hypothetical protein